MVYHDELLRSWNDGVLRLRSPLSPVTTRRGLPSARLLVSPLWDTNTTCLRSMRQPWIVRQASIKQGAEASSQQPVTSVCSVSGVMAHDDSLDALSIAHLYA